MALPKIDTPIYEATLPFSKKKVSFRPFLVKEQKILMMALESKEKETIETAIKQIVNNCTLDDTDIEKLPLIDLEYFFYQLRARSIGEVVESRYKCNNVLEDGSSCGNVFDVVLNILEDIKLNSQEINNVIKITETIGIQLKFPDLSIADKLSKEKTFTDASFELISNCIDFIYDKDKIYYSNETPKEEIISFLESLNQKQFEEIISFFDSLPSLSSSKEVVCSKCGFVHNIEIEGLENFFG